MMEPDKVRAEMKALQLHFREKRDYVVDRLRKMGFHIKEVPDSTFYLWLDLEGLPEQIADGLNFFQACLEEKVIVVPGIFFDLNPSKRRDLFDSPCHHFVRFSYGPKMETLKMGLDGIERVVKKFTTVGKFWVFSFPFRDVTRYSIAQQRTARHCYLLHTSQCLFMFRLLTIL